MMPFDKFIYLKAMRHALGLGVVGFGLIWLIWGEILPVDIAGMSLAIPLVAYIIHVLMLFGEENTP